MSTQSDDSAPHKINNIKTKVYNYGGVTKVKVEFDVATDKWHDKDEVAARLELNKNWILDHLIGYADFDESYSINLFADALINLGRGLLRWDNCVLSQRNGRRALFAGKKLRQIYGYGHSWMRDDKSSKNLDERNPFELRKDNGAYLSRLSHDFRYDNAMDMDREEYYEKMWKIIHKRLDRVHEEEMDWIWKYIRKYINHWWD